MEKEKYRLKTNKILEPKVEPPDEKDFKTYFDYMKACIAWDKKHQKNPELDLSDSLIPDDEKDDRNQQNEQLRKVQEDCINVTEVSIKDSQPPFLITPKVFLQEAIQNAVFRIQNDVTLEVLTMLSENTHIRKMTQQMFWIFFCYKYRKNETNLITKYTKSFAKEYAQFIFAPPLKLTNDLKDLVQVMISYIVYQTFFTYFKRNRFGQRFILDCFHYILYQINGFLVTDLHIKTLIKRFFNRGNFLYFQHNEEKKQKSKNFGFLTRQSFNLPDISGNKGAITFYMQLQTQYNQSKKNSKRRAKYRLNQSNPNISRSNQNINSNEQKKLNKSTVNNMTQTSIFQNTRTDFNCFGKHLAHPNIYSKTTSDNRENLRYKYNLSETSPAIRNIISQHSMVSQRKFNAKFTRNRKPINIKKFYATKKREKQMLEKQRKLEKLKLAQIIPEEVIRFGDERVVKQEIKTLFKNQFVSKVFEDSKSLGKVLRKRNNNFKRRYAQLSLEGRNFTTSENLVRQFEPFRVKNKLSVNYEKRKKEFEILRRQKTLNILPRSQSLDYSSPQSEITVNTQKLYNQNELPQFNAEEYLSSQYLGYQKKPKKAMSLSQQQAKLDKKARERMKRKIEIKVIENQRWGNKYNQYNQRVSLPRSFKDRRKEYKGRYFHFINQSQNVKISGIMNNIRNNHENLDRVESFYSKDQIVKRKVDKKKRKQKQLEQQKSLIEDLQKPKQYSRRKLLHQTKCKFESKTKVKIARAKRKIRNKVTVKKIKEHSQRQ